MTKLYHFFFLIGLVTSGCAIAEEHPALMGLIGLDQEVAHPLSYSKDQEAQSVVAPGFILSPIIDGHDELENPSGPIRTFGNLSLGAEAGDKKTNTSPDQNTYVELSVNPGGPTTGYDYGRDFLYQGHEIGDGFSHITRINLDVSDPAHRVTLLTPVDPITGKTGFNKIDGSTFNPFTQKLLFTEEPGDKLTGNGSGRVIEVSLNWPAGIQTLEAFLGLGGFEGIHPDDKGVIYLQEDVKGHAAHAATGAIDGRAGVSFAKALQPNSFVYRFLPNNPARLQDGGKMQALQVIIDGAAVTFHPDDPDGDITSVAHKKLHTSGTRWAFKWITIHESRSGDTQAFNATQSAKNAGATPFKRPENMAWLPGSGFKTFFFSITGDTDQGAAGVPELAQRGAWGAIFRVDQDAQTDKEQIDGHISLFALGDADHNSFDNLSFLTPGLLLAAEDRGDDLHQQLQVYDSVWAYDIANQSSKRFIALGVDKIGSDPEAYDNEPTGVIVSNGALSTLALLGTLDNLKNARGFITQQHGKNRVFEIFKK